VTLKYDRQDETEMVIRILSFGSAIRVIEPESFIRLLRERIEKQRQLAAFSTGNADIHNV
jgi:predicted DNA-binding transcriptional regulator YafY